MHLLAYYECTPGAFSALAHLALCADYRKTKSKPCFISANFLLKQITILNRMEWYKKQKIRYLSMSHK
jgi:hypothetical protein